MHPPTEHTAGQAGGERHGVMIEDTTPPTLTSRTTVDLRQRSTRARCTTRSRSVPSFPRPPAAESARTLTLRPRQVPARTRKRSVDAHSALAPPPSAEWVEVRRSRCIILLVKRRLTRRSYYCPRADDLSRHRRPDGRWASREGVRPGLCSQTDGGQPLTTQHPT
jgi:hypothetical protein